MPTCVRQTFWLLRAYFHNPSIDFTYPLRKSSEAACLSISTDHLPSSDLLNAGVGRPPSPPHPESFPGSAPEAA